MLINRLEFQAFGPYPDLVVIDFDKINKSQIFLITGPTGAGKTIIFDSISYALFGEASGKYRDSKSLRSDFAKGNVLTYVDLVFTINDQTYHVTRYPKQTVIGRGNREVEREAKVLLELPNNERYDKAQDVKEKLEEVFKLKSNQFKQIVMLAQGDFDRMLFAGTSEKEEIFRKIFGTENIKRFQDALYNDLKKAIEELEVTKAAIDATIENLANTIDIPNSDYLASTGVSQALIDEFSTYLKGETLEQKRLDKLKTDLKKKKEKLIEHYTKMESLADEYNKKAKYTEQIAFLEQSKDSIDLLRKLIEQINKLPLIKKYQDDYDQRKALLDTSSKEIKLFENDIQSLLDKNVASTASISSNKENLKSYNDEYCNNDYQQLTKNIISFEKYDKLVIEVKNIVTSIQMYEQQKAQASKALDLMMEQQNDNSAKKTKIEETLKTEVALYQDKTKTEQIIASINEVINLKKNNQTITTQLEKVATKYKDILEKILEVKNSINQLEKMQKESWLGILAADLKADTACPLCGSTVHPHVASSKCEVDFDEQLGSLNLVKDQQENQGKELFSELEILKQKQQLTLESIKEILLHLGLEDDLLIDKELCDKTKALQLINQQIVMIEQAKIDLVTLNAQIIDNEKAINDSTKQIANIDNSLSRSQKEYEIITEEIKKIEKILPANYTDAKTLDQTIRNCEKAIGDYTLKISKDEEAIKTNNARLEEKKNQLELLKIKAVEQTKELEQSSISLQQQIKSVFSGEDEYNEAVKNRTEFDNIVQKVKEYDEELAKLRISLANTIIAINNRPEPDLNAIELEKTEIAKKEEVADTESSLKKHLIETTTKAFEKLKNICNVGKRQFDYYSMLSRINTQVVGERGKVSFERYVLGFYFQRLLSLASIRLSKMSEGRFTFSHRESSMGGRGKQGLDIDIFDVHTGVPRDVKTLSGGERFKASLALALGLSDIIQQTIGSIRIDTLFVDEGFGSLDSKSLDVAIQTLFDIQAEGKVIGVISHVQEVKNRIPMQITIEVTPHGSVIKN